MHTDGKQATLKTAHKIREKLLMSKAGLARKAGISSLPIDPARGIPLPEGQSVIDVTHCNCRLQYRHSSDILSLMPFECV